MALSFFSPSWTKGNTGEVGVTTIKCNFSPIENIIMPSIPPLLHIPITCRRIEYGFNIKRLHEFFKWDIKVNISSWEYFNSVAYVKGSLRAKRSWLAAAAAAVPQINLLGKVKPGDLVIKHDRKHGDAQNGSALTGQLGKKRCVYWHVTAEPLMFGLASLNQFP